MGTENQRGGFKMPVKISLKAARVNAKLNLIPAAKLIGIGKDTLIKWEKNPELVNPLWQKRIAEVYKCPIDCIFLDIN